MTTPYEQEIAKAEAILSEEMAKGAAMMAQFEKQGAMLVTAMQTTQKTS